MKVSQLTQRNVLGGFLLVQLGHRCVEPVDVALAPRLKMLPPLEQLACKDNWWVKLRSSEIRGEGVLAFGTT